MLINIDWILHAKYFIWHVCPYQVVSWLRFCAAAGHDHVAGLCCEFIAANFGLVSASIDFPNMECDALASLLTRHDLVVADEMTVFSSLEAWLSARRDLMVRSGEEHVDVHLDGHVRELLPLIRFPMMTPKQLAGLMLSPLSESHTELMVDRIRAAMHYHNNFEGLAAAPPAVEDAASYTPRLYTCDRYCASLSVDNFQGLQFYQRRGLVFTAQNHTAECMLGNDEQQQGVSPRSWGSEWAVDVYPKGVWFQKCVTVYQPPGLEVPERVLKTVRVSVSAKDDDHHQLSSGTVGGGNGAVDGLRVKIGILVTGEQDGFEHIRKVVSRNYIFGGGDRVVNFDGVVDFEELCDTRTRSRFLCGPSGDSFKILVVIAPLTKLSCLA